MCQVKSLDYSESGALSEGKVEEFRPAGRQTLFPLPTSWDQAKL
jgi:hypothetical protein